MRKCLLCSIAFLLVLSALPGFASSEGESPAATVEDLAWMTGSWSGALGPNTLEEHWAQPKGGSIAALVRMTTAEATPTMELIVVEEEGDTLVLRLQQWNPGFVPRTEGPMEFRLVSIGERTVSWEPIGDAQFTSLTYARPADDTFTLEVGTAGGAIPIELKAMD